METRSAPDGRTHYIRTTAANIAVLIWAGRDEPHPDSFVYAVQVPAWAGMGTARLPKLSGRISGALAAWCADRVLPVARVDR